MVQQKDVIIEVSNIRIEKNNTDEVKATLDSAVNKALTIIGINAEKYAKALCPVGTQESTGIRGYRGGTLRNSITYNVENETLIVGSNVEYAPYVELGTGPYFSPPPKWEHFEVPPSKGIGRAYVHARPYLRPAIEDHLDEYKDIIKHELQDA